MVELVNKISSDWGRIATHTEIFPTMSYSTPGEFPATKVPATQVSVEEPVDEVPELPSSHLQMDEKQEAFNNVVFYLFAAIFLMILAVYALIIITPFIIGVINSVLFYYKGFGYIKTPLVKVIKKIHNKDSELHTTI